MNRLKVVLVDDEEDFVATLAERLNLRGIETRVAIDGESAVQMIESDPPDVIVMDVLMPGLGGIDLIRRIEGVERAIPVILLTGHRSAGENLQGLGCGAFACLIKPIRIEDLIDRMEEAARSRNRSGIVR
jgi:DNA-binding response OmpR family regulator